MKFTEQDLQLRNLKDIFQHSTEILGRNITEMNSALNQQIHNNGLMNNQRLDGFAKQISDLTKLNEMKLNNLQETIAKQLDLIRNDNSNKLEKIRETVEEKLHDTLEKTPKTIHLK